MICLHCKEKIERWDGAACGWVHSLTRRVMCSPTDATPLPDGGDLKEDTRTPMQKWPGGVGSTNYI